MNTKSIVKVTAALKMSFSAQESLSIKTNASGNSLLALKTYSSNVYKTFWLCKIFHIWSLRSVVWQRHFVFTKQASWLVENILFFVNFGNGNWWQAEAWIALLAGVVEVNALAQGALRQFTQWPWIDLPTFQLGDGHFATEPNILILQAHHSAS